MPTAASRWRRFACSRSTNEGHLPVPEDGAHRAQTEQRGLLRACLTTPPRSPVWRPCLGSGAMTNSIEDVTRKAEDHHALVGSDPEEAHPSSACRSARRSSAAAGSIVVDPRDIGLAAHADIHLKLRPGTNVAFCKRHLNYPDPARAVRRGTSCASAPRASRSWPRRCATIRPELVEDICGIDRRDPRGRGEDVRGGRCGCHHVLPRRDGAFHGNRRRHGAVEHRDDLRQPGQTGRRRGTRCAARTTCRALATWAPVRTICPATRRWPTRGGAPLPKGAWGLRSRVRAALRRPNASRP